jgi:hypothetical protein
MAISPDGRWLYATSEVAQRGQLPQQPAGAAGMPGTLSVISLRRAEQDPARAVVATAAAGCGTVRVVVAGDGVVGDGSRERLPPRLLRRAAQECLPAVPGR